MSDPRRPPRSAPRTMTNTSGSSRLPTDFAEPSAMPAGCSRRSTGGSGGEVVIVRCAGELGDPVAQRLGDGVVERGDADRAARGVQDERGGREELRDRPCGGSRRAGCAPSGPSCGRPSPRRAAGRPPRRGRRSASGPSAAAATRRPRRSRRAARRPRARRRSPSRRRPRGSPPPRPPRRSAAGRPRSAPRRSTPSARCATGASPGPDVAGARAPRRGSRARRPVIAGRPRQARASAPAIHAGSSLIERGSTWWAASLSS